MRDQCLNGLGFVYIVVTVQTVSDSLHITEIHAVDSKRLINSWIVQTLLISLNINTWHDWNPRVFRLVVMNNAASAALVIHCITARVSGSREMRLGDDIFNENAKCTAVPWVAADTARWLPLSAKWPTLRIMQHHQEMAQCWVCRQGQHVRWYLFTFTFNRYTQACMLPERCS